jgi:hypothetical protein
LLLDFSYSLFLGERSKKKYKKEREHEMNEMHSVA